MFDPTNPSRQVILFNAELQNYPGGEDSGEIDVTGFRQLLLGVNVPGVAPFPLPPAGSTIEVDGLGPDGQWYQIQPPINIAVIGKQLIRPWGVFPAVVRVLWVMPGTGGFGYWLVGQG
jgi:hypothetical protein